MTTALLRISSSPGRVNEIRATLSGARIERGEVVIESAIESSRPLNDHLATLWRSLNKHRKFLKRMQTEGVKFVCVAKVSDDTFSLLPSGIEMLHVMQIELKLERRREIRAGQ